MDVSALVSQMHEALSTIHSTLASLDTKTHDDRLDELERQRDSSLATLRKAFEQEGGLLAEKRKAEQDEIAERRRKEDEERERRRKLEDEQIAARDREQDEQREHQLQIESQDVEEETEGLMNDVEADAIRLLEQGRERLRVLEEHRKEINRLIDEQLKAPLPSPPARRRAMRPGSTMLQPAIAESKISTSITANEHIGNTGSKAPIDSDRSVGDKPGGGADHDFGGEDRQQEHDSKSPDSGVLQRTTSIFEAATVDLDVKAMKLNEQDILVTAPGDGDKQASADRDVEEGEVPEASGDGPTSIFGSLGKTIRSLVAGPSASEDNGPPGDLHLDEDQHEQDHDERLMTSTESPDSHGITSPESVAPLQMRDSNDNDHPSQGTTGGEVAPDDKSQLSPVPALRSPEPTLLEMHQSEELAASSEGNPDMSPAVTLRNDASAGERDDDSDFANTVTEEEVQGTASELADEQYAMTGQEAIPGTMTHGSDTSEIVEPIPGTMTHGIDHISAEVESPLDEPTPVMEHGPDGVLPGSPSSDDRVITDDAASTVTGKPAMGLQYETDIADRNLDDLSEKDDAADEEAVAAGAILQALPLEEVLRPTVSPKADNEQSDSTSTGKLSDASMENPSLGDDSRAVDHQAKDPDHFGDVDIAGETGDLSDAYSVAASSFEDDSAELGSSVIAAIMHSPRVQPAINAGKAVDSVSDAGRAMPVTQSDSGAMARAPEHDEYQVAAKTDSTHGDEGGDQVHQEHIYGNPGDFLPRAPHLRPFRDDGTPVEHNENRQEPDNQILVGHRSDHSLTSAEPEPGEDDMGSIPGLTNPDTESQAFMTPLASADFHTPMHMRDWSVSQHQDPRYFDTYDGQEVMEDQLAVTMHGQDDLFDDDGHSENTSMESPHDNDLASAEQHALHGRGNLSVSEELGGSSSNADDTQPEGTTDMDGTESSESILDDQSQEQREPPVTNAVEAQSDEDSPSAASALKDEDTAAAAVASPEDPPLTPKMTPMTTQADMTPSCSKGLAYSRHNPARPHTPEQQGQLGLQSDDLEPNAFAPVDVTNVPWDARRDATPRSMHSQSTLSSAPSSPIHSSLPVDNHEPVIRDSWPTPNHERLLPSGMGRSRNDSQLTSDGDFEPFRYDAKAAAAQWQQREATGKHRPGPDVGTTPHRNSIASSSPGGLFQKMRSIFEPAGGATVPSSSLPSSGRNSPVWARGSKGVSVNESRGTSSIPSNAANHSVTGVTRDGDGYDSASDNRGGGFLAEPAVEDQTDERSSLLHNVDGDGLAVN